MFLYNFNMKIGLALVMGYLFGSIPFAIIIPGKAVTIKLDDNFTVGVGTAIIMELLLRYLV